MLDFMAFLAAVQAEAVALPPVRARPRAGLAAYIGRDDYPSSARARNEDGNVAFQLEVGPDGRVSRCAVLASSGSSTLASTTCRLMRSRARFAPARDASGNAVADAGLAVVRWSLPNRAEAVQDYLPTVAPLPPATAAANGRVVSPARARANLASYVVVDDYPASARLRGEQGTVRFALEIGPDGRVTDCRVTGSSGSSTLDNATCRIMRSRARFTPARDSSGRPVPDTVSSSITWRNIARPTAPPAN